MSAGALTPGDRRRTIVELTDRGRSALRAERRRREGWLAAAIAGDLSPEERAVLGQAVALLLRLIER